MAPFIIKQNDTLPLMQCVIRDENGAVVDLSSFTSFTAFVRTVTTKRLVATINATVVDAVNGALSVALPLEVTTAAGDYEMVITGYVGLDKQTFPTEGTISITVDDTIEQAYEPDIHVPATSVVVYGDGRFPWTPSLIDENDDPLVGASVRVTNISTGRSVGPGTSDATGRVLASDGYGAFRLDAGTYKVVVTAVGGAIITSKFVMDADGNGTML